MAGFGPFERPPAIAAGVSGGPDSMALALLLRAWVQARGGYLLALVVDHRLRPDSTAEAALVASRLEGLGIRSRVLTRAGPAPATGLQAAARAARYALLEDAAAALGILHLALAHHARDQRETIAFRRSAGSGPRGTAGMPAVRELGRVRLLRPLLGVEPERLRALLEAARIPWVEDPSNQDQRFWRARHRAAGTEAVPPPPADAEADARTALERAVAAHLARHARPHPLGHVQMAARTMAGLPEALQVALLGRLVLATAGSEWPPGSEKLRRLAAWVTSGRGKGTALGGVLIERTGADLRFVREPWAVPGPALLPPEGLTWDGRFRVAWHGRPLSLEVRAAGRGWRARARRSSIVGLAEAALAPAVVLETLPLVSASGRALALGPWRLEPEALALDVRFRPRRTLAGQPFAAAVSRSVA